MHTLLHSHHLAMCFWLWKEKRKASLDYRYRKGEENKNFAINYSWAPECTSRGMCSLISFKSDIKMWTKLTPTIVIKERIFQLEDAIVNLVGVTLQLIVYDCNDMTVEDFQRRFIANIKTLMFRIDSPIVMKCNGSDNRHNVKFGNPTTRRNCYSKLAKLPEQQFSQFETGFSACFQSHCQAGHKSSRQQISKSQTEALQIKKLFLAS